MLNYRLPIQVLFCLIIKTKADQEPVAKIDPCYVFTTTEIPLRISGQKCQSLPTVPSAGNVTHLTVTGTAVYEIAEETFGDFPNLHRLELVKNEINSIQENSFRNLAELTMLDLSHNKISFLLPLSLQGLRKLTTLVLAGNSITVLANVTRGLSPSILPSLENLDLGSNQLNTVGKDDFLPINGTSLNKLVLESCSLVDLHPESLLGLPNLKSLNVAKNQLNIENVKQVLENFLELEQLDIRSVFNFTSLLPLLKNLSIQSLVVGEAESIKVIVKEMFPWMPSLRELTILNSNTEDVDDYAFDNLPNLTSLTLRPNFFTNLPKGVLLSRLERLSIGGIPWKPQRVYFEDYSFSRMAKLQSLDLSYLSLINLKKGTFIGLSNLRHLDLRKCSVISIEENTFDPLSNLETLDVTNNTILARRNLVKNLFPSLKSLKRLVYRYGKLEILNITQKPFRHLVNLEYLDLAYGSLTQFVPELLAGLKNLVHLNLQGNYIREWNMPILSNLSKLQTVNISSNLLVTVTDNMLRDFEGLKYVDLSSNPFNCSCNLLPFLNWTNSSEVIVYDYFENDNENYICDNPKGMLNFTTYGAHSRLLKECNIVPSFTALISIAVILILILLGVVGWYVHRLNAERKLWLSADKKNFIYDAFVSYSANDSDWVFNSLLPRLESNTSDLKLCVYDRDFVAGRGISECILDSIQCSRRTILILSNNFLQSPWCRFETDLAHHTLIDEEREGLLLVKLEELKETLVSPQLNYLLKTKIYLAWSKDPKEQEVFWRKLHKALKHEKKEEVAKIV